MIWNSYQGISKFFNLAKGFHSREIRTKPRDYNTDWTRFQFIKIFKTNEAGRELGRRSENTIGTWSFLWIKSRNRLESIRFTITHNPIYINRTNSTNQLTRLISNSLNEKLRQWSQATHLEESPIWTYSLHPCTSENPQRQQLSLETECTQSPNNTIPKEDNHNVISENTLERKKGKISTTLSQGIRNHSLKRKRAQCNP